MQVPGSSLPAPPQVNPFHLSPSESLPLATSPLPEGEDAAAGGAGEEAAGAAGRGARHGAQRVEAAAGCPQGGERFPRTRSIPSPYIPSPGVQQRAPSLPPRAGTLKCCFCPADAGGGAGERAASAAARRAARHPRQQDRPLLPPPLLTLRRGFRGEAGALQELGMKDPKGCPRMLRCCKDHGGGRRGSLQALLGPCHAARMAPKPLGAVTPLTPKPRIQGRCPPASWLPLEEIQPLTKSQFVVILLKISCLCCELPVSPSPPSPPPPSQKQFPITMISHPSNFPSQR